MKKPLFDQALIKLEAKRSPHQLRVIKETVNALIVTDTDVAAARLLKISSKTLYERKKKFPEIVKAVELQSGINVDKAKALLMKKAIDAARVIVELMHNSNKDDIRLKSAQDVLERSGLTKQHGANVQVNVLNQIKNDRKKYGL